MNTLEIIRRALMIIRVIGSNEAPDDDDAKDALTALNTMMRRWEAKNIALGWNTVEDVNDPLPAPPEAEEAIAYNLAIRLCPLFGKQMDPQDRAIATSGLNDLRNAGYANNPLTLETYPFGWGYYNIRADQYE